MFTPGHLRVQCLCGGVWREVPRGVGPMRGQYSSHAITLVQSEARMMISLSGKYLTIIYASIKLVFCHTEFYLCDPKDVIMNDNIKSWKIRLPFVTRSESGYIVQLQYCVPIAIHCILYSVGQYQNTPDIHTWCYIGITCTFLTCYIASPQTAWLFYHSVISTRSPLINQLSRDWIIKQLLSSVTSPSFDEIMNPPCTNSSYHTNQCLITDFVFGLQILVCIKASARDEGANYSTFIYHYKNNWLLVSPSCIIWFSACHTLNVCDTQFTYLIQTSMSLRREKNLSLILE